MQLFLQGIEYLDHIYHEGLRVVISKSFNVNVIPNLLA